MQKAMHHLSVFLFFSMTLLGTHESETLKFRCSDGQVLEVNVQANAPATKKGLNFYLKTLHEKLEKNEGIATFLGSSTFFNIFKDYVLVSPYRPWNSPKEVESRQIAKGINDPKCIISLSIDEKIELLRLINVLEIKPSKNDWNHRFTNNRIKTRPYPLEVNPEDQALYLIVSDNKMKEIDNVRWKELLKVNDQVKGELIEKIYDTFQMELLKLNDVDACKKYNPIAESGNHIPNTLFEFFMSENETYKFPLNLFLAKTKTTTNFEKHYKNTSVKKIVSDRPLVQIFKGSNSLGCKDYNDTLVFSANGETFAAISFSSSYGAKHKVEIYACEDSLRKKGIIELDIDRGKEQKSWLALDNSGKILAVYNGAKLQFYSDVDSKWEQSSLLLDNFPGYFDESNNFLQLRSIEIDSRNKYQLVEHKILDESGLKESSQHTVLLDSIDLSSEEWVNKFYYDAQLKKLHMMVTESDAKYYKLLSQEGQSFKELMKVRASDFNIEGDECALSIEGIVYGDSGARIGKRQIAFKTNKVLDHNTLDKASTEHKAFLGLLKQQKEEDFQSPFEKSEEWQQNIQKCSDHKRFEYMIRHPRKMKPVTKLPLLPAATYSTLDDLDVD